MKKIALIILFKSMQINVFQNLIKCDENIFDKHIFEIIGMGV